MIAFIDIYTIVYDGSLNNNNIIIIIEGPIDLVQYWEYMKT